MEKRECPGCGGKQLGFDGQSFMGGYETCQVICENCGMRGPLAKGEAEMSVKAVELWNTLPRGETPCSD